MQKITACLWFDGKAEEAMRFYTSIFKHSKVGKVTRYGEGMPGQKGSVMTATWEIEGQEFMGLNGGPMFKFNEAVSFVVNCKNQEEVEEGDAAQTQRVMEAVMKMVKLDVKTLTDAYEGAGAAVKR